AARRGRREDAAGEAGRALAGLKQARAELAKMLSGEPEATPAGGATAQAEIEAHAEALARELEAEAEAASEEAAHRTEEAAAHAAEAREALEREDPVAAADAQRAALEALNAARSAMEASSRSAQNAADQLASRQDYVQRGMQEVGESLDKLSALREDEEQRKRLDLRDEAEEKMSE